MRGAVENLGKLGAEIVEVSVPEHLAASPVMFSMLTEGFLALLEAGGNGYQWEGEYWPELAEAIGRGFPSRAGDLSPQVKLALALGLHRRKEQNGAAYARASNVRRWIRAGYDRALADVDLVILPTTPGLPHRNDPDLALADRMMRSWGVLSNTSPTSISGHPALSMPLASSGDLPVGVMAVAPRFEDARLLSFARTVEQTIGWSGA